MPSHNPVPVEQLLHDQQPSQTKVCAACQSTLIPSVFLPEPDPIVCITCREHLSTRAASSFRNLYLYGTSFQHTRAALESPSHDDEIPLDSPSNLARSYQDSTTTHSKRKASLYPRPIHSPTLHPHHQAHNLPSPVLTTTTPCHYPHNSISSDPLTDITRLRMRPQGHYCLYPGAIFQGTQKSGRNSYDVMVTIVDVDFSSSFLCGYLRIRGLTDDWPELTTYFDAEIIGSRYGFLTQNWGATEQEDLVHWGRFPAFRNVKSQLRKPHLNIPDRDRGAVFMRWKERFLVPDHRVQDINGASFAGFYYICVDFNPPNPCSTSQHCPPASGSETRDIPLVPVVSKVETAPRVGLQSNVQYVDQPSDLYCDSPGVTMSGFYYHHNSEPYQQLSLCHLPEHHRSSFEFR